MELTLYRFSKKINSMKNPLDSEVIGVTTQCRFKDNTSIENPVIILDTHSEIDVNVCNYCYIDTIMRYYWIDDIVYVSANLVELHCSIDVLATYKENILEQKAFVLYSESKYNDYLVDARIPFSNQNYLTHAEKSTIFSTEDSCVVFATLGGEQTEEGGEVFYNGGYNYYAVTEAGWKAVLASLSNSSGIIEDIKNFFGDAANSIIFARRYPIPLTSLPISAPEAVRCGKWTLGYPANTLRESFIHPNSIEIEVPSYPSNFRAWEPYTRYMLYFPFLGTVDLAPSDYGKDITLDYVIDLASGLMNLNVCRSATSNVMSTFTTEIGEQLPIVSNQSGISSAISSGIGAAGWGIGAAAAGSSVMGITAIMMASSSVTGALSSTSKQHGSFGGSRAEQLKTEAILLHWHRNTELATSELRDLYGSPLCRVVELSTLTGYCQTREFHMDLDAQKSIIEQIEEMMDGGVYIE